MKLFKIYTPVFLFLAVAVLQPKVAFAINQHDGVMAAWSYLAAEVKEHGFDNVIAIAEGRRPFAKLSPKQPSSLLGRSPAGKSRKPDKFDGGALGGDLPGENYRKQMKMIDKLYGKPFYRKPWVWAVLSGVAVTAAILWSGSSNGANANEVSGEIIDYWGETLKAPNLDGKYVIDIPLHDLKELLKINIKDASATLKKRPSWSQDILVLAYNYDGLKPPPGLYGL